MRLNYVVLTHFVNDATCKNRLRGKESGLRERGGGRELPKRERSEQRAPIYTNLAIWPNPKIEIENFSLTYNPLSPLLSHSPRPFNSLPLFFLSYHYRSFWLYPPRHSLTLTFCGILTLSLSLHLLHSLALFLLCSLSAYISPSSTPSTTISSYPTAYPILSSSPATLQLSLQADNTFRLYS